MIAADLDLAAGGRVLALGCHADDIEIGLGGTLLTLCQQNPGLAVTWVVLSADEAREQEARASAAAFAGDCAEIVVRSFRDSYFPYVGVELKEFFDELGREVSPDVVFTHTGSDLHQDHRLVAELTRNTFRDHLILEYEVPKYDGDLGSPNVFMPLSEEVVARKVELLLEHFPSQRGKHWFTDDLFRGLARLRGAECASETSFAEAFYCRKLVLGVGRPSPGSGADATARSRPGGARRRSARPAPASAHDSGVAAARPSGSRVPTH
jgi:LmbE family N-acetylglucosaminyl deacetylase